MIAKFSLHPHCFASDFVSLITFLSELRFLRFFVPLESLESVKSKYIQKEHFEIIMKV